MRFELTKIDGVVLIIPDPIRDQRGFFARLYCQQEFAAAGIVFEPLQTSLSRNDHQYTLRGMHYSCEPEAKLVRCVRGRVLDVVFDIRRSSPTFGNSISVELSAANAIGLYIAPGLAHGFLTLEAGSDLVYQTSRIYNASSDRGVRWNDPQFGFQWQAIPMVISEKDATYPDFSDA